MALIGLDLGAGERANAFDALLQKKLLRCLSLIRLYSPLFTLFTSVLIVVALGQSGLTNGQFRGFITNNVFVFVSFLGGRGDAIVICDCENCVTASSLPKSFSV